MSAAIPHLATPRLLLRPLQLGDAPAVQEHFPQWEIVRLLAQHVPWPYPPNGAYEHIHDVALPAMEAGAQWQWSMRLKQTPEQLIGVITLMDTENDNRGFWVGLPWQGQGYAGEACAAVTAFWFEVLKRPVLRAPKAAANLASRRISESSGMRLVAEAERPYVSGVLPAEIWEITREEWLDRHGRRPKT